MDTSFLRNVPGLSFNPDGTLLVGPELTTGHPGIFAGGDMVRGSDLVVTAIWQGRLAAKGILAYLGVC